MFSNPIKRLSESLAQAQEQARQQRQRLQQDSKSVFDADNEEASLTNGNDPDTKQAEDTSKPSEETKIVSGPETKDTSLPKEVRIKLAKLAKYEDRHPSKPPYYKMC